jgi:hypothetical protein
MNMTKAPTKMMPVPTVSYEAGVTVSMSNSGRQWRKKHRNRGYRRHNRKGAHSSTD